MAMIDAKRNTNNFVVNVIIGCFFFLLIIYKYFCKNTQSNPDGGYIFFFTTIDREKKFANEHKISYFCLDSKNETTKTANRSLGNFIIIGT